MFGGLLNLLYVCFDNQEEYERNNSIHADPCFPSALAAGVRKQDNKEGS